MLRLLVAHALRYLASRVTSFTGSYELGFEFVTGSFTNVTTLVERASWDNQIVDMLSPPTVNNALFELSNDNGTLTPRRNTNLVPGVAVRFRAHIGGSTYPLFFGRVTDISFSPMLGKRTTLIQARDDWDRIQRLQYNTGMLVDTNPQSVFTTLMSQSMVNSFQVGSITDVIPFVWYKDKDSVNALHELVKSGHYQLTVDGNGTYKLRERFWSFFNTAVNTYTIADDMRINLSQDSIINRTKMISNPRRQTTDVATLAFLSQPLLLQSGQAFGFWVAYQDPNEPSEVTPVGSIITQVASTDYYAAANADGSGDVKTSQVSLNITAFAASAVCSLKNVGPGAVYLTRFQIRGYPIQRLPEVSAQYDVTSSQTKHGLKQLFIDPALVNDLDFMEQLTKIVTVERNRGRETNEYSLTNEWPDVISNFTGDVFSMVDSFTGYVTQWQVRGMSHEISMVDGLRHTVNYHLETFDNFPFLVLDHATFGQLDAGRVLAV